MIPRALLQNSNFQENDSSLLEIQTKFEFRFDAIKKLSSEARSALNLYECAVSPDNADSTL